MTDPVLRERVLNLRRLGPVPSPDGLDRLDAVLISHAHFDHLDLPSLRRVAEGRPVFTPRGCARALKRHGLTVHEVEPGDRFTVGELEVLAIRAKHNGRRHPTWPGAVTLAYVVEGPSRIFFAGDTDLFDAMGTLGDDLAVALLPIWGWGSRLGPGHLNPESAARAAGMLRPRVAVPIHWGTLASPRANWQAEPHAPALAFSEAVSRLAPGVDVRVLAPGEEL